MPAPESRIFGIVGWHGSGKTTLICRLLPALVNRGLRVSTLKHAHHSFDIDRPGKDSWAHRAAGASEVLVASRNRWALMHELRDGAAEPGLQELLRRMGPSDLVLVEGFKHESHPKLEVFRHACGQSPLYPDDGMIIAVASDAPPATARVPYLGLDDVEKIAALVLAEALPIAQIRWRG
ncbi:MAG: molybdopterin-guanine dinucleotide biosynthesis protein B [Acetobacteraceae bacterium]